MPPIAFAADPRLEPSGRPAHRAAAYGAALAAAVLLAACSLELQNPKPAQELALRARPPGSAYAGWRIFQDKCASCHGTDATGTAGGPDLLPRVRDMGAHRFFSVVLQRYDALYPTRPVRRDPAERDAAIEEIVQRQGPTLTMPAWQGEPRVEVHIADLHAYVAARAQGTLGPGRPPP